MSDGTREYEATYFLELLVEMQGAAPCIVCGHLECEHKVPNGDMSKANCLGGRCAFPQHAYQPFPKEWGRGIVAVRRNAVVADGDREWLVHVDKAVHESYWVRAATPMDARLRLRNILSQDVTYEDAQAPGRPYEPTEQDVGEDAPFDYLFDAIDDPSDFRLVTCPHAIPIKDGCRFCFILLRVHAVPWNDLQGFNALYLYRPDGHITTRWRIFQGSQENIDDMLRGPIGDPVGEEMPWWFTPTHRCAVAVGDKRFTFSIGGERSEKSFDSAVERASAEAARTGAIIHTIGVSTNGREVLCPNQYSTTGEIIL